MNANRIVLFFVVIACVFSYGMVKSYFISCFEPIETGPCRSHKIRFAYDWIKKQCVQFTYGGCKGNRNNFKTLEACLRDCVTPRY